MPYPACHEQQYSAIKVLTFLRRQASHFSLLWVHGVRAAYLNNLINRNFFMTQETKNRLVNSEAESRQVAEQARQTEWEGKGFLRDLFLGKFRFDYLYPFPLTHDDRPEFATFYRALEKFLRTQV